MTAYFPETEKHTCGAILINDEKAEDRSDIRNTEQELQVLQSEQL